MTPLTPAAPRTTALTVLRKREDAPTVKLLVRYTLEHPFGN